MVIEVMNVVPNCDICMKPLKLSQDAILNIVNGLNHEKCANGREIKDKGTVDELLDRHPKWLGELREYITE